jgi:hypothetical protein
MFKHCRVSNEALPLGIRTARLLVAYAKGRYLSARRCWLHMQMQAMPRKVHPLHDTAAVEDSCNVSYANHHQGYE